MINQQTGERNFHSFYYLLNGANETKLTRYGLNSSNYTYLSQGNNSGHDYKIDYNEVNKAMKLVGFDENTVETIWGIVASILHLGNIKFEDSETNDKCAISKSSLSNEVNKIAKLLGISEIELNNALTTRVIATGAKDIVTANHTTKDAAYSRDAFAKVNFNIFNFLFYFL